MWEGLLSRDSDNAIETPRFLRQSEDGAILLPDIDAEHAAVTRMEALGFKTRADLFVLAGENLVARFFAFEFPRLKSDWQVTLSAQASKARDELQPLAPKLEVLGSGENWFELRYSLGTPDGQTFSASELQRLLRSGQSQTRLRNGRTAVFDADAIGDFEEVLRDCEPRQNQPGVYRINSTHASYVTYAAQDLGVTLRDLQKLTTPSRRKVISPSGTWTPGSAITKSKASSGCGDSRRTISAAFWLMKWVWEKRCRCWPFCARPAARGRR